MNTRQQWQLTVEAAKLYERYPARYILGPWAPLLVRTAEDGSARNSMNKSAKVVLGRPLDCWVSDEPDLRDLMRLPDADVASAQLPADHYLTANPHA